MDEHIKRLARTVGLPPRFVERLVGKRGGTMPQFFETMMGRKFYEGVMPELVRQMKRLNDNLEKVHKPSGNTDPVAGNIRVIDLPEGCQIEVGPGWAHIRECINTGDKMPCQYEPEVTDCDAWLTGMTDGIESLTLALHCAGFDITNEGFRTAFQTACDAASNNEAISEAHDDEAPVTKSRA